jgi:hypothetical protein
MPHLKTIRAAGQISFKGYGRAAAHMTALDASRLLIASAGSTFAKDSFEVLTRFANLKPLRRESSGDTLEKALARRIAELPIDVPPEDYVKRRVRSGRPFGSRRLTEDALQLLEPSRRSPPIRGFEMAVRWRPQQRSLVRPGGPK